jgi:hypothetical protein
MSIKILQLFQTQRRLVSQPHFRQVWGWSLTLPKLGTWSPPGLLNVQSSTTRPKTPRIGVFLVSLKRSWSVDIENGLALVIWTSAAQVMGKRRAGSQTGNLTPDHWKSGIDPLTTCVGGVQHVVGKILTRATILVQTSSRSEIGARSYGCSKSWESNRDTFETTSGLHFGSPEKKWHSDATPAGECRVYYRE